jgi:hypothetical protein
MTVYDEAGWVATERFNTNSHRATPNPDGSYTLSFNPADDPVNPLDVSRNWNGLFRCYLPMSADSILEFDKDFVGNHPIRPTS